MRRRRYFINYDEIPPVIGEGEFYPVEKGMVRDFLRPMGFRRDGLSKKFEVYKKKVNGDTFRVKFYGDRISFDRMIPKEERTGVGDRASWRNLGRIEYHNIRNLTDLATVVSLPESLTPEELAESAENQDTNEWLMRLGVKF